MQRFRSGKGFAPINQAEAYWRALCEPGAVPRRSQIDPRGLQNILEHAFILERIAPGIARFRLAGSHLVNLAGMEVRGMPITAFFTPSGRGQVGPALEEMFEKPSIAEFRLSGETRRGCPPFEARMILLPLRSDLGDVSRALGVLVVDGDTGGAPRRLEVSNILLRAAPGASPIPAPEPALRTPLSPPPLTKKVPAPMPRVTPPSGFAEDQTPLKPRVPYLRLVKSDD